MRLHLDPLLRVPSPYPNTIPRLPWPQVEAKKKAVMDRHLELIVGQTEKFSKMLAANLKAGPGKERAGKGKQGGACVRYGGCFHVEGKCRRAL